MERDNVEGMEFTVEEPKERAAIPTLEEETFYNAEFMGVTKRVVEFGPVLDWIFELTDSEHEFEYNKETKRRRVKGGTGLVCNPKTKLYKWYSKLLGREPRVGEKISLKSLVGVKCQVMIKNAKGKKQNDEGEYPIFANVLMVKGTKGAPDKTGSKKETKPEKKVDEGAIFTQKEVEGDDTDDIFGNIV